VPPAGSKGGTLELKLSMVITLAMSATMQGPDRLQDMTQQESSESVVCETIRHMHVMLKIPAAASRRGKLVNHFSAQSGLNFMPDKALLQVRQPWGKQTQWKDSLVSIALWLFRSPAGGLRTIRKPGL
jgi:hypothetical protein